MQKYLDPRPDVAIGIIRIPEDRPASNHLEAGTGIKHQSPQLIHFRQARPLFDLDKLMAAPPVHLGRPVRNPAVVGLGAYLDLLDRYIAGTLSEERFQWGYLGRLQKEADWRSESDFALLNSLFPNPDGRAFTPGKVVALEFQAQISGRAEPWGEPNAYAHECKPIKELKGAASKTWAPGAKAGPRCALKSPPGCAR